MVVVGEHRRYIVAELEVAERVLKRLLNRGPLGNRLRHCRWNSDFVDLWENHKRK